MLLSTFISLAALLIFLIGLLFQTAGVTRAISTPTDPTSAIVNGGSVYGNLVAGTFVLNALDIADLLAPVLVLMAVEMKKGCNHGAFIAVGAGIWAFIIMIRYFMLVVLGTSFTASVLPQPPAPSVAAALPLVCFSIWVIWIGTMLTVASALRLGHELCTGEARACCNGNVANPNCGCGNRPAVAVAAPAQMHPKYVGGGKVVVDIESPSHREYKDAQH